MNKEKIKEGIYIYSLAFIILFLVYAVVLNDTITSDHVGIFKSYTGVKIPTFNIMEVLNRIAGGRFSCIFTDYIWWFMGLLGVNYYSNQFPVKFLMLICLAESVTILVRIFKRYFTNQYSQIIIAILSLIAFINPYFVEIWIYTGIEWTVGILTSCYATYLFVNKKYFWSAFWVIVTIGFYQSFVENFLMMTSTFIFLEYRKSFNRNAFMLYVKMFLIAGITSAINIISQKISISMINFINMQDIKNGVIGEASIPTSKNVTFEFDILDRFYHKIFGHYWYMSVRGFGYFPFAFLFIVTVLIFSITFYVICKRYGCKSVIHYIIYFAMINFFTVAIYFVIDYGLEARIVWNYFIAISMIFIVLFIVNNEMSNKIILRSTCTVLVVFLLADIYVTNTKVTDMFIAIKTDEQLLDAVETQIEYYEKTTGIEVTEIAARKSQTFDYQSKYTNLKSVTSAFDRKLMANEWADVEALNYYSGKEYNEFTMTDEEYKLYFGSKSWNSFLASEQMIFVGNKLYWAIY